MSHLIATGHAAVTRAAADVFHAGGNAFDAAVGAGFASSVAEPLLFGLGGGGFLMARTSDGREVLYDFFADVPGRGGRGPSTDALDFREVVVTFTTVQQPFHVGWGSVAVPGALKGLLHVHERLGRIPLGDVLRPAVTLARAGVRVNRAQSEIIALLEPILRTTDEAWDACTNSDGSRLGEGDVQYTPRLADFLESLIEAPDDFYTGDVARSVARAMQEGGGLVTLEDLAEYRVIEREPLALSYHGARALTNPAPSLGGPLIGAALRLQQGFDLSTTEWGSARHLRTLAGVMAEVDRIRDEGDYRAGVSDERIAAGADRVRVSTGGTTHVSIADHEGNVAAMTGSLGEGSACFAPGTGVMLNNMLGEDDLHPEGFHQGEAGSRMASMMSPTILRFPGDRFVAMGSGGSKRIRTAIHQVVTNLVDFGMPLEDAVNAPRIHRTEDGVIQVEPGYAPEHVDALRGHHEWVDWSRTDLFFGGVHAVSTGTGEVAADHRRSGDAAILR